MRKLFKYNQFLLDDRINENLDKAKKLLRDRATLLTAVTELDYLNDELKYQLAHDELRTLKLGDFTPEQQAEIKSKLRTVKLSDDQVRRIERDDDFKKIREISVDFEGTNYRLDRDNIGWLYMFTYFYFVEMVSMDELKDIYLKLIKYKGLLDKLPKKFDLNFIDVNVPNNSEILIDGLDSLDDYRKIKRVYDQLTPVLKKDYKDSPEVIKQHFADVARSFEHLGGGDEVRREKLWKAFFGEEKVIDQDIVLYGKSFKKGERRYFGQLSRYTNIREFIRAAQNFLKASENETIVAFYEKIDKCNDKYGFAGADIVFDDNGILVIEVKSFHANQMLNGHTRHCIKDYASQWDNYVSNHYNKQYYIYNFNIPQYDNLSTIGITIEPGQRVRACHAKDDSGMSSNIKTVLKKWEKEYKIETDIFTDVLKPMSKEEIDRREKARAAERELIKKGISTSQIIKYVKEDGANINKDNAIVLLNAVEENDFDKVKTILDLGGNPNLRNRSEAIINKAQNLNMIKLLVENGSELTGEVFNNICDDIEAVKYCIAQGLDINFDSSLPVRRCCKGSWRSREDIGEGYEVVFKLLIDQGAILTDSYGRNMAVKWASEYNRLDFIDYMIKTRGVKTGFKAARVWLDHSRKIPDKDKQKVIKYLDAKMEEYGNV